MPYCPKCGAQVRAGDRFCGYCGARLAIPKKRKKVCPRCGREARPSDKFCAKCGMRLEEEGGEAAGVEETTEVLEMPPDIQERLSPAALIFVFEDILPEKDYERVKKLEQKNVWLGYMVAATLFALKEDEVVFLRPDKRGRVLKKDTVLIIKRRRFKMRTYGILSQKIYRLREGEALTVYDLLYNPQLKDSLKDPPAYFIQLVIQHDFDPRTREYLIVEKTVQIKRSFLDRLLGVPKAVSYTFVNMDRAQIYRDQALALKQLLHRYLNHPYYGRLFKIIMKECDRALWAMHYYEGY
ncbi:zinc ribbon domain-containing protein [archaeon]|nr:zinc ribbon domain-containing protein [archaeon]